MNVNGVALGYSIIFLISFVIQTLTLFDENFDCFVYGFVT